MSRNRVGLIGYNCASGLGEKNRQISTHLDIDCWLVKPHKDYPTLESSEYVETLFCRTGLSVQAGEFFRSIDTVLFDESPLYKGILTRAKAMGKRVVCIIAQEWMPQQGTYWLHDVDLFLCPTRHAYELYREELPCSYTPWPVDTDRFPFRQRTKVERFLFINGRGGWNGRKGAETISQVLNLWPEMPLDYYSQTDRVPFLQGPNVRKLPTPELNTDLYITSDILISPHTVDGTGLEQMEALSSGMPVINTKGRPWNEIPSIAYIGSTVEKKRFRRLIDWHIPSAEHLVSICKNLLGKDITQESKNGRDWAESRSFSKHSQRLNELIRG